MRRPSYSPTNRELNVVRVVECALAEPDDFCHISWPMRHSSRQRTNERMDLLGMLSFPAHGPKRAYVALCALYPVCAELFLPYESSADRRPAKPKPLAYYVESLQGQRNRQEYSIFCFTPSSRSFSAPPTQRT